MDALAPFRIPVATLKGDEAYYEWTLGPDFLASFDEHHLVEKGLFNVTMTLHRAGGLATLVFLVQGHVSTPCDRCLANIQMPVQGEYQIVVKFGDPSETTDEIVFIDPESPDLNVGPHLYDFILLSIPISRRIEDCDKMSESPCDATVLAFLSEKNENDIPGGNDDSPWEDLKK